MSKNKLKKEAKKENFLEDLQRVQAEFENYVKRVEKEKEIVEAKVKGELLLKVIGIKEDMEKAVKNNEDEGVKMIFDQVKKVLEEEKVSEIKAVGEDFNHELHEVVKKENEGNEIIEEVQKGYKLGEKILRISKVILGENKNV